MVEEGLKVKFIGEDGNLAKTLGDLTSQLKRFQDGLKNATNTESFSRIQRAIDATKQRIDLLNNVNQFQNFRKGSDQATQSILNLSRVAQDAPYGFLGIANNINPLLESFQRLQKETGSTKASLSALGSSLAGAGGLGLAVGVISSLLVVFGDRLFSSKNKADELSESIGNLAEQSTNAATAVGELNSILSSISSFRDISFKISGKGNSALLRAELQTIQTLRDEATRQRDAQINRDLIQETDYFNQSDENRKKIDEQIQKHNENVIKLGQAVLEWNEKERLQKLKIQLQEKEDTEDAHKKSEDASKKAQAKREELDRESLRKLQEYQNERSRIISEFIKDFENVKIFTLPDVGDPQSNAELFRRLHDELVKAANNMLPVKYKVKTQAEFDNSTAVDVKNIPLKLTPTIEWQNTDLNLSNQAFALIGKRIGDQIGTPFGDTFQAIFKDAVERAIMEGLSGEQLEQFKEKFAAFANVAATGIYGLGNAFASFTDALLQGENGFKSFGEVLKNTFRQIAVEIAKDIALAAILSALSGGKTSFLKAFTGLIIPGHATGLYTVPKDDYVARLHKNEMVVPAGVANMLRSSNFITPSFTTPSFRNATATTTTAQPSSGSMVKVVGELRAHGKELKAVLTQTEKSQRRAT